MSSPPPDAATDVYTIDEIARATGVPAASVRVFTTSGQLCPVANGRFFAEADVVRLAPAIRALSADSAILSQRPLFSSSTSRVPTRRFPLAASIGAHGFLLVLSLWLTSGSAHTQSAQVAEAPRLVFLAIPGPGGGGGGSGAFQRPASRLERAAGVHAAVATPAATLTPSTQKEPDAAPPKLQVSKAIADATAKQAEPLPSRSVIAPVVMTASQTRDRDGVVDPPASTESIAQGVGTGGRSGSRQGQGNGDGVGSGLEAGSGGGTGGGPSRPGTGIEPPRLLREVKADYTESARRRQIEGDVELEIVINRDGSVGQVTVTRGLGEGLDQKAVAAVRQWQFAPARRRGEAMDVVVDVSVEFKLR